MSAGRVCLVSKHDRTTIAADVDGPKRDGAIWARIGNAPTPYPFSLEHWHVVEIDKLVAEFEGLSRLRLRLETLADHSHLEPWVADGDTVRARSVATNKDEPIATFHGENAASHADYVARLHKVLPDLWDHAALNHPGRPRRGDDRDRAARQAFAQHLQTTIDDEHEES